MSEGYARATETARDEGERQVNPSTCVRRTEPITVKLNATEIKFILQSLPKPFIYELKDAKSSGHKRALLWKAVDTKLSAALTQSTLNGGK